MRILYCSTKEIFRPLDGRCSIVRGRIDLLAAKGHEVHAVLFAADPQEAPPGGMPGVAVHRIPLRASAARTAARMALGLLPYQVALYRSRRMRSAFDALMRRVRPDVVLTDMLRTFPLVEGWIGMPGGPKVVADIDDLLHRRYFKAAREDATNPLANTRASAFSRMLSMPILARLGYLWEGATLERYTRAAVRRADHAVLVSGVEAGILRAEVPGHCPVSDIPMYVDVDPEAEPATPIPKSIGIMGNFKIPHNLALATLFLERILPLVRKEEPGAVVHLIGSNPPDFLREIARKDPGVVISGYVADLRKRMSEMSMASCYMTFGTGIKTKVLEFMALGVPVAASRVGMEGIPAESGVHCLVAEDAEGHARDCVRLLRDAEARRRVGLAGRAMVASRFSGRAVGQKLDALLDSLCHSAVGPGQVSARP